MIGKCPIGRLTRNPQESTFRCIVKLGVETYVPNGSHYRAPR
jgi:hypothetical protein